MNFKNVKFVAWLLAIILCSISFNSAYPKERLKFERLPLDKGAALNLTYCMLQDHKGFLWFGTMYGLVKYDGKSYSVYKNNPEDPNSISFDDIISLYEDSNNNIWIGTWGGGLNKLDQSTGKFTRFVSNSDRPDGINDNIIWTISEDNDGYLWFGTETGGLNKYDPVKNVFNQYMHSDNDPGSIGSNSVHFLYKDSNGTLWICSKDGLSKYVKSTDSFISYKINLGNGKRKLPVNSVLEDENSNLLVATAKGIYRFNINSGIFTQKDFPSLNDKYIHTLCKGLNNSIWAGSADGLFRIDVSSQEVKEYYTESGNSSTISGNNILNLLSDKSGILWINSYGHGINKLTHTESQFLSYSNEPGDNNSLSSNTVTSFCIDGNNTIWIGTSSGLNRFDEASGRFAKFNLPDNVSNSIRSVASDDDMLWIGTARGMALFNTKTNQYKKLPSSLAQEAGVQNSGIPAILNSHGGKVYIGTYGSGMFVYSSETGLIGHYTSKQFHSDNTRTDYILTFYRDDLNPEIVWIGTYGGLIRMDTENKVFNVFSHQLNNHKSLSNDYVFSILRDRHNTLWVGTANGLNKFDEAEAAFIHYFEKDGLPNSVISSMVEDSRGKLWISTNYGISEFNPSKNEVRNYSKTDGMNNNLYLNHSYLKDDNGRIYFGGINGLDIINTNSTAEENYLPGIYITSVEKVSPGGGWSEAGADKDIELNYDENFFNINFISLDYTNPVKNLYKYKLEGVDDDWINSGNNNKASYTDLAPGEYVFRVKGSNSSGVFNTEEARLNITILPPFWRTGWFSALLILLFLGCIYFIYRFRVRQKINRALELEKIKEEESEKLRSKTAADFHDELGHRLTRISLLSEIIKRKLGNSSAEITDLLEKISTNSMELYEGTKDFIWAIDPHRDSIYELLIRLKDFGDELFEDSDILFEVNGLEESLKSRTLTMDWKRHLALIFKEGMNNSLRHGGGNKISIDSKVEADNIELSLSDNGRGFMPNVTGKGNGLKNMKKRADKLYAELEVQSSPGNGTRIYFKGKIPGKEIHYN